MFKFDYLLNSQDYMLNGQKLFNAVKRSAKTGAYLASHSTSITVLRKTFSILFIINKRMVAIKNSSAFDEHRKRYKWNYRSKPVTDISPHCLQKFLRA